MSAAVSGTSSDQVTPSRMSKVQVSPSSELSHDVANPGSYARSFTPVTVMKS